MTESRAPDLDVTPEAPTRQVRVDDPDSTYLRGRPVETLTHGSPREATRLYVIGPGVIQALDTSELRRRVLEDFARAGTSAAHDAVRADELEAAAEALLGAAHRPGRLAVTDVADWLRERAATYRGAGRPPSSRGTTP